MAKTSYTYQLGMYLVAVSVTLLVIVTSLMFAPGGASDILLKDAVSAPEFDFIDCCVQYAAKSQVLDEGLDVLVESAESLGDTPVPLAPTALMETEEVKSYLAFSEDGRRLIRELSAEYGVDEATVMSICFHESHFNPSAIGENENGTMDWGIAQCNDTTLEFLAQSIGINNMNQLLNEETGIRACCALLDYYQERGLTGDDILLGYQEGYSNFLAVKSGIDQPWPAFEETKACVEVFREYLEQN